MKFLSVIFTIIIIYYVLKLIGRIVFPWLLKRWVNKMAQRHAEAFGQNMGNQYQTQEKGKVTVQYQQTDKKTKRSDGEYVDYEEVK
jgi:hypothetical protein